MAYKTNMRKVSCKNYSIDYMCKTFILIVKINNQLNKNSDDYLRGTTLINYVIFQ